MGQLASGVDQVDIYTLPVDNQTIEGGTTDTDNLRVKDGGISTDKVADDAVTLDKLAHGTANKFLGFDENGIPVAKSGSGISTRVTLSSSDDASIKVHVTYYGDTEPTFSGQNGSFTLNELADTRIVGVRMVLTDANNTLDGGGDFALNLVSADTNNNQSQENRLTGIVQFQWIQNQQTIGVEQGDALGMIQIFQKDITNGVKLEMMGVNTFGSTGIYFTWLFP